MHLFLLYIVKNRKRKNIKTRYYVSSSCRKSEDIKFNISYYCVHSIFQQNAWCRYQLNKICTLQCFNNIFSKVKYLYLISWNYPIILCLSEKTIRTCVRPFQHWNCSTSTIFINTGSFLRKSRFLYDSVNISEVSLQ